jgi:hypothetical protein
MMAALPFWIRRLLLLAGGFRSDRDQPDLDRLAGISDPEDFVWEMLPHAARSFAPSILLLPKDEAQTAAVGYLYARMLDLSPNRLTTRSVACMLHNYELCKSHQEQP